MRRQAFQVVDERHPEEDTLRNPRPPDKALTVRDAQILDEQVDLVLGKKPVQCCVERATKRLRQVRSRGERLKLPLPFRLLRTMAPSGTGRPLWLPMTAV